MQKIDIDKNLPGLDDAHFSDLIQLEHRLRCAYAEEMNGPPADRCQARRQQLGRNLGVVRECIEARGKNVSPNPTFTPHAKNNHS